MTAEELYAMEAETGRTSEWEPLYRAEKARADAAEAALRARDQWMEDNLREVELDVEPWRAPIVEVSESGDRWREACGRAEAAVARVRALHWEMAGPLSGRPGCVVCGIGAWPCSTAAALDAP